MGSFISAQSTASLAALRSQACLSEASTKVGDHLGSPRDELFFVLLVLFYQFCPIVDRNFRILTKKVLVKYQEQGQSAANELDEKFRQMELQNNREISLAGTPIVDALDVGEFLGSR